MINIGEWANVLPAKTIKKAEELAEKAAGEREKGKCIFPPQEDIFRALQLTQPEDVRVCIVGQDPYHAQGQANGLAFSVPPTTMQPRSLKNIFKELTADVGCPYPNNGELSKWAKNGVLLLNTVLTVEEGTANSHAGWGWQDFTYEVFRACAMLPQPVVFILWGGQARAFTAGLQLSTLTERKKACIWSSHPSPLGARKGNETVPAFIGSRPFSKANAYLAQMGAEPIDWALP